MSNSILFITGDKDVQHDVWHTHQCGYWTAAFNMILEKHGILDFKKATQEVLGKIDILNSYDVLIVSWLPSKFWKTDYVQSLKEYNGIVFMEGPFPEFLREYLGVSADESMREQEGYLKIVENKLEENIVNSLKETLGKGRIIPLTPKKLLTREIGQKSESSTSYAKEHITKWSNTPYWIEKYQCQGATEEVRFVKDDFESSIFFRKGRILASSFQVLSYLVHYHTAEPLEDVFFDCDTVSQRIVEIILFGLFVNQTCRYKTTFLQVAAWPWGKKYCLTLRHDVDRIPKKEIFDQLLNFEKEEKLGVSWYWIPERIDKDYMGHIEECGQEIGLHTMKIEKKKEELQNIEKFLETQNKIYGECLHGGGGGGDYWIGYPVIKKAIEGGLEYTEGLSTIYDYPHRFPVMTAEGHIELGDILVTSHSRSVDAFPKENKKKFDTLLKRSLEYVNNGYYFMLLNHPDKNFESLVEFIHSLPPERVDWTCRQTVQWWNKTHCRENLTIEREVEEDSIFFHIYAKEDVEDLKICFHISREDKDKVQLRTIEDGKEVQVEKNYEIAPLGHYIFCMKINLKKTVPLVIQVNKNLIRSITTD